MGCFFMLVIYHLMVLEIIALFNMVLIQAIQVCITMYSSVNDYTATALSSLKVLNITVVF